jgi:hypothetical protein
MFFWGMILQMQTTGYFSKTLQITDSKPSATP